MSEVSFQPSLVQPASDARSALSIGARVTIVGSVHFDGPIQLDGVIQGEVRCRALTVSERGAVEGLIVAESVSVAGDVNGSIYADRLLLKSACDVEGEIFHRELALEDGCYFEGKSRRHTSPTHLAPTGEEL